MADLDPSAFPDLAAVPRPLLSAAEIVRARASSVVFRRGCRPRFLYFVLDGELRLVRHTRRGQEVILQRVRRGYIAEASIEAPNYHCDAVAAVESRLLRFPAAAFRSRLGSNARFRDAWLRQLAGEVRRLRARCERLSLRGARERIVHFVESEGGGAVALGHSLKSWAAELGLTHEALYRALARLKSDGEITVKGDIVELRGRRQRGRSA